MRNEIKGDTASIVVDPCNKTKQTDRDIAHRCGYLPEWFIMHCRNPNKHIVPIKDWMEECYRMGDLYEMAQGARQSTIHDDLTMTFPGDPTFYPLVHIKGEEGVEMVQWESGIVAFRDKPEDKWFLTRMD
jgi:hypothetical protein